MNASGACYDTAAPQVAAAVMFVLIVKHHGGVQEHALSDGRTIVGRLPSCDIVINDDSISRQHARLDVRGDELRVADLQSRNGTYLAGVPVHDTALRGGERLAFGDVEATIERRAAPAAAPARPAAGDHTMVRRLDDTATGSVAAVARVVEAPRLINLLG